MFNLCVYCCTSLQIEVTPTKQNDMARIHNTRSHHSLYLQPHAASIRQKSVACFKYACIQCTRCVLAACCDINQMHWDIVHVQVVHQSGMCLLIGMTSLLHVATG